MLGTWVSAVGAAQAVDEIGRWIETPGRREYVCVTGVHAVMESVRDPWLRGVLNRAGLTLPAGLPLARAGRRAGARDTARVHGPDLMLTVLERAARRGWSSYFYGGAPGVAELLGERVAERVPGLKVAGAYSPPFRPQTAAEDADIVRRINDSGADVVWVALPTPQQERWLADHRGRLHASVLLGVGAAFDVHAGRAPRAPRWMRARGPEWAYRPGGEPKRLWSGYLRDHAAYLARIALRPPCMVVPALIPAASPAPPPAAGCCGTGGPGTATRPVGDAAAPGQPGGAG